MDFLELARARKSTRKFLSNEIPNHILVKLIEAAQQAPSGGNCQPWYFYVVKNRSVIRQIHENAYPAEWILTAPAVIVVCADIPRSERRYGERGRDLYCIQDTAAAIQSILLAATDFGIGTCWCGAFDESAISEMFSLPAEMRPVALIPLGYPAVDNPKPKRRPIEEIATFIYPESD